ncbi:MAG TPA: redoxin domain-containing protein [Vicinamibacterales bacterium]|nr:redoxin domain-containing protein [Vicinamibacterales bacterium]
MTQRSWLKTGSLVTGACVLVAATAMAQAPNAAPPPPPSVKVGQAAPDFTARYLAMENGRPSFKPVKLSDYKGQKNVVLAFFPAAFSPGCTSEMAKYQETSGEFNKNNTVVLGMSVDSTWANSAFADKLGVKFPILSDANRDISKSYGVWNEQGLVANRSTFVIDKNGIVQKEFLAAEALDPAKSLEACALLKEVK